LFDNSAKSADDLVSGPMVTNLLVSAYAVKILQAFAKVPNDARRRSIVALMETIAKSPL
jgi:hypothetical protein